MNKKSTLLAVALMTMGSFYDECRRTDKSWVLQTIFII